MAEIYSKTVGPPAPEKTTILDIREGVVQPFQAPDWLDLRIGMYLSLTDVSNDDLITGLTDSIAGDPLANLPAKDRYWIGVKDRTKALPTNPGTKFIGFSNTFALGYQGGDTRGDSQLTSSNRGIAAGTDYWWPNNSRQRNYSFVVLDGVGPRGYLQDGLQQHFPQNVTNAGGYAVLLGFRLQRAQPHDRRVTIEVFSDGLHSADMAYTNDPSKTALETALETWTTQVLTFGPIEMSAVPDSLHCYWPFRKSRLRIHNWGFLKAK
jgi:hypothetical protein